MKSLKYSIFVTVFALLANAGCKAGDGPSAPDETYEAGASFGSSLPIGAVEGQETILRENSNDGTQGNVSSGTDQQTPPANGTPGVGTPTPTPTPTQSPAPVYAASCAEIKKSQPNAVSGVFKIYLNAANPARVPLDVSCDMSEDGGGWTMIMNYTHKANTNPPLAVRTTDLPQLASDTLGTDESALTKNWGHSSNALLAKFVITELRFLCRSSQNARIVHFKTPEKACIASAQLGTGNCVNAKTGYTRLTGHTGILPLAADKSRSNEGDAALTLEPFAQTQAGNDTSWSISGNNGTAWECDYGSNNAAFDTIHRVWFR